MLPLDAATVLLQWATGGLLFLWVTSRRREVGVGYGWLLRGTYMVIGAGALAAGLALDPFVAREAASAALVVASATALGVSVVRRRAGVAGEHERRRRREGRVAAMVGEGEPELEVAAGAGGLPATAGEDPPSRHGLPGPQFPPSLDLVAPVLGGVGLVLTAFHGDDSVLALVRLLAGAAFLGAVSDAMLLGHWYLVQPGLARAPLLDLVRWVGWMWPVEVAALLLPTGMISALTGSIDDGYGGLLSWFWAACAVSTIALVVVTRAALRERAYSAVMAATGLLYLAILTAFGTDLVARAVLAG